MTTSHYQAARENLFGHVPFLQRRMPGMLIRDLGGALLVDSGLGSDTFNKVLWECGGDGRPCRVERGAEDGLLQASKDWFAGKRPRDLLELPGMALPPATERPFTVWASAEDEGALNRQRTAFGRNGHGFASKPLDAGRTSAGRLADRTGRDVRRTVRLRGCPRRQLEPAG